MLSLAARRGLKTRDLYEHADNKGLRDKRSHPNILAPGDEVTIPDPKLKSVTVSTEAKHRFVMQVPRMNLRLVLRDRSGQPYAGKRWKLTIGTRALEDQTTGEGLIDAEVPALAQSARLRVWLVDDDDDPDPDIDREIAIGHLDPVDTITGVQGRLMNLGYRCDVTGELDEATRRALRAFRAKEKLPEVPGPPEPPPVADAHELQPPPEPSEPEGEPFDEEAEAAALLDDDLRKKLRERYEGG